MKKYQYKKISQAQNRYLDILVAPNFQGVNRLFVLSLIRDDGWKSYKQYYLLTAEIKGYNIMIDGKALFDKPIRKGLKTCDNIREIATD